MSSVGLSLERRHASRVAQERHVADATAGEIEDDRLGRRVVARPADQLDTCPEPGRRQCNAGRGPARGDRTVARSRPIGDPMTTITG